MENMILKSSALINVVYLNMLQAKDLGSCVIYTSNILIIN